MHHLPTTDIFKPNAPLLHNIKTQSSNIMTQSGLKDEFLLGERQSEVTRHLKRIHLQGKEQQNKNAMVSSNYEYLFNKYSNKDSFINQIIQVFDNGNIFNRINQTYPLCHSENYRGLHPNVSTNISMVQRFFTAQPIKHNANFILTQLLTMHNYSSILCSIKQDNHEATGKAEMRDAKILERMSNEMGNMENYLKDTKIYLLLKQITSEKKRKDSMMFYVSALQSKLEEFLDYITQDLLISYHLTDKIKFISSHLQQFRGTTIDSCSVITLLEVFFLEYKDLQKQKLLLLKQSQLQSTHLKVQSTHLNLSLKSGTVSKSVKGQLSYKKAKGLKRQDTKRSKLSQVTDKRKPIQVESQWITDQSQI